MTESRNPMLPVADIDAARRFYTHALGCRLAHRAPAPVGEVAGGPRTAELYLELFGQPLSLRQRGGPTDGTGARLALVLGVDDWCTLSERLREHGIPHEVENARRFSITPGEQCAIVLEDPDGNAIELRGFAAEETQLAA